jgi:hypothetical protein
MGEDKEFLRLKKLLLIFRGVKLRNILKKSQSKKDNDVQQNTYVWK